MKLASVAEGICGKEKRKWNWKYYLVPFFTLAKSGAWLTLHLLFILKQQLWCVSCFIKKQRISKALIFPTLDALLPPEQTLHKFNRKDFISDERQIEKDIFNYSVNKGKWKARKRNELQMHVSEDLLIRTVGEERSLWGNSNLILKKSVVITSYFSKF